MPKPNFKMQIKLQIVERCRSFSRAVKTPRGAQRGDLILISREDADQEDAWGVLTTPLLSGVDEWCYIPLSPEEVCRHLARQLHESNCNFTAEDFMEAFAQGVAGPWA